MTLKERQEIELYLGITDNEDRTYKNKCIAEFERMAEKYAGDERVEFCLIEDLGVWIEYTEIVERGELVVAFIN